MINVVKIIKVGIIQSVQSEKTSSVPKHLGLILDGNRRWANDKGLPSFEGHRQGYLAFKNIAQYAINKGIEYVSAYIFSTENWNRTQDEVSFLMNLAFKVATEETKKLHEDNIKIRFLGSKDKVDQKLLKAIEEAEDLTKNNTKATLAICFNYGGHQEIVDATRKIIGEGVKQEDLTPEKFAQYLYAPEVPPIDLMIRTSGEQRISNFMLWRVAYSELIFVDKHWPDFTEGDLDDALAEYANRSRRFGG